MTTSEANTNSVREDALIMIKESLKAVLPETAVIKALDQKEFSGKAVVVAIGKAAWTMANAAKGALGGRVSQGIVITKYEHSQGAIPGFAIIEAGHPIPDENSVRGARKALELVANLEEDDHVILLLSGGGSSLFEKPMDGITLEDIMNITGQLLGCGADIVEINTIRKRLSAVKGGRFALQCGKAKIYAIVLSDIIGDRLDYIASGPVYPDSSTSEEALRIVAKYGLQIEANVRGLLSIETPKTISNCETVIAGSVSALCEAAAENALKLGYRPVILTSTLECEAKEAGKFMAAIAREIKGAKSNNLLAPPCAVIAGGETVVHLVGKGKGGRNQELALSAALGIVGLENVVVFSLGSDGTDGPTDAAGGIVDGTTTGRMKLNGIIPETYLDNNDSYNALKASGDLLKTGPTGTNVNDLIVLLCK
jgi:glycerate 2-kinase